MCVLGPGEESGLPLASLTPYRFLGITSSVIDRDCIGMLRLWDLVSGLIPNR